MLSKSDNYQIKWVIYLKQYIEVNMNNHDQNFTR